MRKGPHAPGGEGGFRKSSVFDGVVRGGTFGQSREVRAQVTGLAGEGGAGAGPEPTTWLDLGASNRLRVASGRGRGVRGRLHGAWGQG